MMKQRHLIARLQQQLAVSGHETRKKLNERVKTAEAESKRLTVELEATKAKLSAEQDKVDNLAAEVTSLKAQISDLLEAAKA